MTKNQKIALGCGGVGCFGLILLLIAGGIGYYFYSQGRLGSNSNSNSDFDDYSNSNSNSNSNIPDNTNETSDELTTADPPPSDSSDDVSSSMADDGKHKLFQAGATCGDQVLMARVMKKVGLTQGTTGFSEQFMKDHIVWVFKNSEFLKQIDTPDKARAYVEAHIDD